jgi:hypothetical protein
MFEFNFLDQMQGDQVSDMGTRIRGNGAPIIAESSNSASYGNTTYNSSQLPTSLWSIDLDTCMDCKGTFSHTSGSWDVGRFYGFVAASYVNESGSKNLVQVDEESVHDN